MSHEIKIMETPDQGASLELTEAQLIMRNIENRINSSRITYLDRFHAGRAISWRTAAGAAQKGKR